MVRLAHILSMKRETAKNAACWHSAETGMPMPGGRLHHHDPDQQAVQVDGHDLLVNELAAFEI
jgi:hypothetical protein